MLETATRATVLAVDDNDANRYAVARVLRREGFEVLEAGTGSEALALAAKRPDLVILDVRLPDISGFEVCRRLKDDPATSTIPVLHISASFTTSDARAYGLEGGADGYLTHPFEPAELVAHVRALLRVREAEARVMAAVRQWRATFDGIPDGVCLLSPGGTVLRCNRVFSHLVKRPFSAIIERPLTELLPSLGDLGAFPPAAPGGGRQSREIAIGHRWFRLTVDAVQDESGVGSGSVCVLTDLTERREAESHLAFLAEASRTLALSLAVEVTARGLARLGAELGEWCAVDLEEGAGGLQRVAVAPGNVALEGVLLGAARVPRGVGSGHPLGQVLDSGRTVVVDDLQAVDPGGEEARRSIRALAEAGTRSMLVVALPGRSGFLGAFTVGSARPGAFDPATVRLAEDLARRAAAGLENAILFRSFGEAVERERQRSAQLRGSAAAAVAVNSALTAEEILAVMAEQARRLVVARWSVASLTPEEPGGQLMSVLSHSAEATDAREDYEHRPGSPELYGQVRRENRPVRLTREQIAAHPGWLALPAERRRGGPMNGWMAVPLTGPDGHHLGVIQVSDRAEGAFSDDDEAVLVQLAQLASVAIENSRLYHKARRAEENLRAFNTRLQEKVAERTFELEETNKQLEAFSYSVAHNLRAPLRAIHGLTEALLDDAGGTLDESQLEQQRRVVEAARQMDSLIQDLLIYSRIGRQEMRMDPVQPSAVVAEALAGLEGEIRSRQAAVVNEVPSRLPAVLGHHGILVQVLVNLLSNALKFVPPGTLPEVRLHGTADRSIVRIVVEDRGIGIAPEHLVRIFEPFERLHRPDDFPGTGVGLATVKRAVERMGGHVRVESELNRGSRFLLELRRAEREP